MHHLLYCIMQYNDQETHMRDFPIARMGNNCMLSAEKDLIGVHAMFRCIKLNATTKSNNERK